MDNNKQNMEWIDKYLDDRLTAGELEVFERMQQEDQSFRELVHDMKLLVGGIRCSARDSLGEEISGWESKQKNIASQPKLSLRRRVLRMGWISLAAAACLTAILYMGLFRPPQSERIANSIYSHYYDGACKNIDVLTYRADKNTIPAHHEAFAAYDNEDYQKAAALFSEIPQKSDTVLFYLGNSWLAEKEFEKAAECFRNALETGKFRVEESRWHLALSLLKAGKADESESLLRELSGYRNIYQVKSLEILTKLASNK
jgi:tetratricopeptide (TPR) repeat protein